MQDPDDAIYRGLPESARAYVQPHLVLPAAEIGAALAEWATMPPRRVSEDHYVHDDALAEVERGAGEQPRPGALHGLTCPSCSSAIWEEDVQDQFVFRCRIGHSYSLQSFLPAESGQVETALWTALHGLEERAALTRRLAERMRNHGGVHSAAMFERRASATLDQAVVIRELLQALEAETAGREDPDDARAGCRPGARGDGRRAVRRQADPRRGTRVGTGHGDQGRGAILMIEAVSRA